MFSYWVLSDVFDESGGPSGSYILGQGGNLPFGQVFGLMTFQGMRKAAFNAFKMLNYLGPKRLMSAGGTGGDGVDAMATMSASGDELQILVYDYFATLNTHRHATCVTVNVSNLPAALAGKQLFVTHFRRRRDAQQPVQRLGQPEQPHEPDRGAVAGDAGGAAPGALAAGQQDDRQRRRTRPRFTIPSRRGRCSSSGVNRPVTGRNGLVEIEGEDYDGQSGATKEDQQRHDARAVDRGQRSGSSVFFENVDFSDAGVGAVQLRVKAQSATTSSSCAPIRQTGTLLGTCAVAATAAPGRRRPAR